MILFLLWGGIRTFFGSGFTFFEGSFMGAPDTPGWTMYKSGRNGWSVQFPDSWRARKISNVHRGVPYTTQVHSLAITNVDWSLKRAGCGKNCWSPWVDNVGLPANGILVQIGWSYGGGFTCTQTHSTALPLSLAQAERSTTRDGAGGTPQLKLTLHYVANRPVGHSITAWMGSKTRAADLKVLERIVASISYRSTLPPAALGNQDASSDC